jgi:hypothetical protein
MSFALSVDKMVISPRIRGLVETLSPGAFRHLTDIDLEALDQVIVKPLGIYGSKSEIVRYLKSYGAISDEVYVSNYHVEMLYLVH